MQLRTDILANLKNLISITKQIDQQESRITDLSARIFADILKNPELENVLDLEIHSAESNDPSHILCYFVTKTQKWVAVSDTEEDWRGIVSRDLTDNVTADITTAICHLFTSKNDAIQNLSSYLENRLVDLKANAAKLKEIFETI